MYFRRRSSYPGLTGRTALPDERRVSRPDQNHGNAAALTTGDGRCA